MNTKTLTILRAFTELSMRQAEETSMALRKAFERGSLPFTDAEMEDMEKKLNNHYIYCEKKLEALDHEIL